MLTKELCCLRIHNKLSDIHPIGISDIWIAKTSEKELNDVFQKGGGHSTLWRS